MNKIAVVAFTFAATAFTAAGLSPSLAQTASAAPSQAASTTGSEASIAPAAEERDVGIAGYTGGGACLPLYSAHAAQVGPVTGETEEETVARAIVDTECH